MQKNKIKPHRHRPRQIRNDKAHRPTTHPAHHAPEPTRRLRCPATRTCTCRTTSIRHALLAQHLLKHASKLFVAELFPATSCGTSTATSCGTSSGTPKPKRRPREPSKSTARGILLRRGLRDLRVVRVGRGGRVRRIGSRRGGEAVVQPCGVVLAPSRGIGEDVVGIIHLLELAGAAGTVGTVGGDAVRVVFQGGAVGGGCLVLEEERERGVLIWGCTACMHPGFAVGMLCCRFRGWRLEERIV